MDDSKMLELVLAVVAVVGLGLSPLAQADGLAAVDSVADPGDNTTCAYNQVGCFCVNSGGPYEDECRNDHNKACTATVGLNPNEMEGVGCDPGSAGELLNLTNA